MTQANFSVNPFSLMLEPEQVLQAMERSEQLRSLRHKEYHPLDKPLIPYKVNADQLAYDAEVDALLEELDVFDDSGVVASRYGALN